MQPPLQFAAALVPCFCQVGLRVHVSSRGLGQLEERGASPGVAWARDGANQVYRWRGVKFGGKDGTGPGSWSLGRARGCKANRSPRPKAPGPECCLEAFIGLPGWAQQTGRPTEPWAAGEFLCYCLGAWIQSQAVRLESAWNSKLLCNTIYGKESPKNQLTNISLQKLYIRPMLLTRIANQSTPTTLRYIPNVLCLLNDLLDLQDVFSKQDMSFICKQRRGEDLLIWIAKHFWAHWPLKGLPPAMHMIQKS